MQLVNYIVGQMQLPVNLQKKVKLHSKVLLLITLHQLEGYLIKHL